jgi:hypothetical protein
MRRSGLPMIQIKAACGWEKIHSEKLGVDIYLVKHRDIITPDKSLARYTPKEVSLIHKDTDLEELKIINDAKELFQGMLIK